MPLDAVSLAAAITAQTAASRYGIAPGKIIGEWDASTLTAVDGTSVAFLADGSGNGHGVRSLLTAAQPTVGTDSGQRHLAFGSGQYLSNVGFGNGGGQPTGWPQPLTFVTVAKANTTAASGSSPRRYIGFVTTAMSLGLDFTYNCPAVIGSATGALGGAPLNDGVWHIVVGVADLASNSVWVDGFLVATSNSQSQGANAMKGVALGADGNGGNGLDGNLRHALIISDRLLPGQVAKLTAALAAKWGMS